MDAFWNLYKSGGMKQVSVTKICNLTGYNRSTFYDYFIDIYDVLDSIESNLITPSQFHDIIFKNMIQGFDNQNLLSILIDLFDHNKEYFPILLGENGDLAFRHKLLKSFLPIILKELPVDEKKRKHLIYILEYQNAAIFSVISLWYQNKKDIPQEELVELLISITQNGIKSELINYD